jgi:hypothetical protein
MHTELMEILFDGTTNTNFDCQFVIAVGEASMYLCGIAAIASRQGLDGH